MEQNSGRNLAKFCDALLVGEAERVQEMQINEVLGYV